MKIPTIFVFLVPVLFFNGCWSQKDCEKHYEFTIPLSLYPVRDTFHIGDTIWVEGIVLDKLMNNLDSSEVEVTQLPLYLHASIAEYNDLKYAFSSHLFSYVNDLGAFDLVNIGGPTLTYITFVQDGANGRKFRVGIVVNNSSQITGTFELDFGYLRTDYEKYEVLNKRCLDIISFKFNLNNGQTSNYDLLPQYFKDLTSEENFINSGGFAFRVVD